MKPSWFDWLTVLAIFTGPIAALFAQRALDWLREKKERRVNLYRTVMSLRAQWLNPDSVRALNSIDTIFDKRRDKPVRDAWAKVIAHVYTEPPDANTRPNEARDWNDRLVDLRVDLYQLLGNAVGYNHTIEYIKTHFYNPNAYANAELENQQIRQQFAKAITENGLKVLVVNQDRP